MPELPELESLSRFLDRRISGLTVDRIELASFSAIKTVEIPIQTLVGRRGRGCARRGKYLCLGFEESWLVAHLARAGWVRWYDRLPATRVRPGSGPIALRLGFAADEVAGQVPGPGLDLTEAGTQKQLAIWLVDDLEAVAPLRRLGLDPLDPSFDADALRQLLQGSPGTLKSALTDQHRLAGVGNAYSDEALHLARLSPFKNARTLGRDETARLHAALIAVLREAVQRAASVPPSEIKSDKWRALRVHGRAGEPCPVCGQTIREVAFATRSLQYCPECQTAGRPLADRRLSRLLK